jgi:hypothetical protein
MRAGGRLVLGLVAVCLIFVALLCGVVIYCWTHPAAVKPVLEQSISRATRTAVTIETLSWTLDPARIQAKGIVLQPLEESRGFHLEISRLSAEFDLEGPLGRRCLLVEDLQVHDFSLEISPEARLPEIRRPAEDAPFPAGMLKKLAAVVLFREVRFHKAAAGGEVTARSHSQSVRLGDIRLSMRPDRLVEIVCSTHIEWPAEKLRLDVPRLHMTTQGVVSAADSVLECLMTAGAARFHSPDLEAGSVEAEARLTYVHSSKLLTFEPIELRCEELTLNREPGGNALHSTGHLRATGTFNLRESRMHAEHFQLSVAHVGEMKGRLRGRFRPRAAVALEIRDGFVLPQRLLSLLSAKAGAEPIPVTLSGPVALRGTIEGSLEEESWSWRCGLQARLERNPLFGKAGGISWNAGLTGKIEVGGKLLEPDVSACISFAAASVSAPRVELEPFGARLCFSGTYPVFRLDRLTARLPSARLHLGNRGIPIAEVQIRVEQGTLNTAARSVSLTGIRLDSPLFQNIRLSLQLEGRELDIDVKGEQTGLLAAALSLGLVPGGWEVGGGDSLAIRADVEGDGNLSFTSRLAFQGLHFQDHEARFMGEDISVQAEVAGRLRPGDPRIRLRTSMEVPGGEILLDRFYLNLKENPFSVSGSGRCDLVARSLEVSDCDVGLEKIVRFALQGHLGHGEAERSARLSLRLPRTALEPLFRHFVLEPFRTEVRLLPGLEPAGAVCGHLDLTGDGSGWKVLGRLRWLEGDLSLEGKGVRLQGIELDLPVWCQNEAGRESGKPLHGALSIDSVDIPFLSRQPLELRLDAGPNRLSVPGPTNLRIPGESVRVGPLAIENLCGPRLSVETSLTMKAVDLTPLLADTVPEPLKAEISGTLDPIVFEGDSVNCTGELRIEAFDGEIILSDLGASGLFSPAPLLRLSAEVNDLNLAALTTGTAFGRIEGVLRGSVEDLEIVHRQPQSFQLLLETVRKAERPQKISVRAVDSIARIGGARSPFIGAAGLLTSFFEQFPYEKIGVRASLKNDMFRVNGTIRRAGKEYFVRRGGLTGVDIINQNPDNRISFKDMVRRIKRVTGDSGGPVVR